MRLQACERLSDNTQRNSDCGTRSRQRGSGHTGPAAAGRPAFFFKRRAMITDRKTISIMKACEVVGVSRRTIYNWIASGKVEYVRTAGGSVRIFVDTLWRDPGRAGELTRKEAS